MAGMRGWAVLVLPGLWLLTTMVCEEPVLAEDRPVRPRIVRRGAALLRLTQARRFEVRLDTSARLARVARAINRSVRPAPTRPAPELTFGVEKSLRNLGVDIMGTLLSPMGLSRAQVEYLSERTFEAATGQNIRLYEAKW